MNIIKTYNTAEDFLAGRRDDLAVAINNVGLNFNDNVPLNPTKLSEQEMKTIVSRIPQYPFIVSKWRGVVNANGLNVVVNFDEGNVSDRTKQAKAQLKKKTYDLIFAKKGWDKIESQVVELIAREGMAVVRLNDDNHPVVDSRFRYNIYWNETQKKARYAYKDPKTGHEMPSLSDLTEGVEIFVIKHPSFAGWPVPLSPVDTALLTVRLDFHAIVANQKKFDNGMIGQIFLKFSEDMNRQAMSLSQGEDKNNWFMQMMRQLNDKFKGSKKANQFSHLPGLEDAIEVGANPKDMQFYDIVKELTPERIAWTWLMTTADFGTGTTSTYNNVMTFDDSLYDKVGRSLERQLAQCLNEWFLPTQGVRTTGNYYVEYNQPKDHGKIEEIKSALEEYKNNAITLNEYRALRGMDPIEGGDVLLSQMMTSTLPQTQEELITNVIDAVVQPKRGYRETSFTEARDYRATTVDKALATEEFTGKKGFLAKLTKAIEKQLLEYSQRLEGFEEVPSKVEIKPLETFYSFPALKKDLLQFAGIALDTVRKDKRTTFALKKEFFDGEYPKSVLDFIDDAVSRILKGDKTFKSVDVETASQTETLIRDNASESVFEIANKIRAVAESMSMMRAELIAQTEVANAVEGTRETMYKSDPVFEGGFKKWLTSVDERVRPSHNDNASQGMIPINDNFSNGFSRAGTEPRCRCDVLYYTADEGEGKPAPKATPKATIAPEFVEVTAGGTSLEVERGVQEKLDSLGVTVDKRPASKGSYGTYFALDNNISVSPKAPNKLFTYYHEAGHALDYKVTGNQYKSSAVESKIVRRNQKEKLTIATDRLAKNLREDFKKIDTEYIFLQNGKVTPLSKLDYESAEAYGKRNKHKYTIIENSKDVADKAAQWLLTDSKTKQLKHYKYLLSEKEVVADAFAQYITDRKAFEKKAPNLAKYFKDTYNI